MDFCLLALDHINWFFSENFTFCVNKTWTINNNKPSDLFEPFPNYFAYNGVFWKYIFDKNPEKQEELLKLFEQYMNEGLKSLMKIFKNESFENEFVDCAMLELAARASGRDPHARAEAYVFRRFRRNGKEP